MSQRPSLLVAYLDGLRINRCLYKVPSSNLNGRFIHSPIDMGGAYITFVKEAAPTASVKHNVYDDASTFLTSNFA